MRYILELKQSLRNKAIAQETGIPLGTVQDCIVGKTTKPNETILAYVNDRIERYYRSVNSPSKDSEYKKFVEKEIKEFMEEYPETENILSSNNK